VTPRFKALPAQIEGTASGFSAVITAETIDRDGEVLIPQGMNSTEFDRNPVLFWNHDYAYPVGRCVGLRRAEREIRGDFVFAKRPQNYMGEFYPEVTAALVGQGIVNAVSVGYAPEEGGTRRATDADRKKYGNACHTIFSRWKLLEVSLAPMQANPNALITAVRKGLMSPVACKRMFGFDTPKRVIITVPCPAKPARSTKSRVEPKLDDVVAVAIARRLGRIRL
jgi:HK97 family phage prohead protease